MRVMIVVPWYKALGGVMTVAEDLADHLQKNGHTTVLFHPAPTVVLKTRMIERGIREVRLRLCFPFAQPRPIISTVAFIIFFPFILAQLLYYLWNRRIGIVNVHYPIDNYFYFAICRVLLPIRLVVSIHGSEAFTETGVPKTKHSRAFRFLLRRADVIVLPSSTYRKRILQVFPQFEQKTIYIHNGVGSPAFDEPGENRPARANGRYILCVAHLKRVKGIDNLLRAAQPLLCADSSLKLVLVGDGPERHTLEDLASSLGINSQISFVGMKARSEVRQYLHGCEVFVLPSRAESFGLAVVEALACKKPVIATAVGGIPEILENEKSGLLVEPDDPKRLAEALARVIADEPLRKSLAENGHHRAMKHFSLNRTMTEYVTAFSGIR